MIAVIFELQAADGQRDTYLALAAELKPLLSSHLKKARRRRAFVRYFASLPTFIAPA